MKGTILVVSIPGASYLIDTYRTWRDSTPRRLDADLAALPLLGAVFSTEVALAFGGWRLMAPVTPLPVRGMEVSTLSTRKGSKMSSCGGGRGVIMSMKQQHYGIIHEYNTPTATLYLP